MIVLDADGRILMWIASNTLRHKVYLVDQTAHQVSKSNMEEESSSSVVNLAPKSELQLVASL